jgi:hypothetical protein
MRDASNIFEFDENERLLGFRPGERRIFNDIGKYLRSLHKVSMFCGHLVNKVFILVPTNTVSFLFLSLNAQENCINLEQGIRHNLVHL